VITLESCVQGGRIQLQVTPRNLESRYSGVTSFDARSGHLAARRAGVLEMFFVRASGGGGLIPGKQRRVTWADLGKLGGEGGLGA
jgi:hypothetical protein